MAKMVTNPHPGMLVVTRETSRVYAELVLRRRLGELHDRLATDLQPDARIAHEIEREALCCYLLESL